jgi:hemerythrin-like domain-containing protein
MTDTDTSTTGNQPSTARPDLSFVFAIHHALTEDAALLAAAMADLAPEDRAERIPTMAAYLAAYTEQLHAHHTHEDEVFFPALAAHVGREAMAFDLLDAQHHVLDEVLPRLVAALDAVGDDRTGFAEAQARAVAAAGELVACLAEHLDLEESATFPLYTQSIPVEEHLQLEARVQAMGSLEHVQFMVPWLFDRVPAPVRDAVFANVPPFPAIFAEQVQPFRTLARSLVIRRDGTR